MAAPAFKDIRGPMSYSALKAILESPKQYKEVYLRRGEGEQLARPEFNIGALLHELVMPGASIDDVVCCDTRRGTNAFKALCEANPGETIYTSTERDKVLAMLESLRSHAKAWDLIVHGIQEPSLLWQDPDTDLPCKGQPDTLTDTSIVDLKTASHWAFKPSQFQSRIEKFRYDMQAAFYTDGAVANGFGVEESYIVCIQNERPFDVGIHKLSKGMLENGRRQYKKALRIFVECTEKDTWPGLYEDEVQQVEEVPMWALSAQQQTERRNAID